MNKASLIYYIAGSEWKPKHHTKLYLITCSFQTHGCSSQKFFYNIYGT